MSMQLRIHWRSIILYIMVSCTQAEIATATTQLNRSRPMLTLSQECGKAKD